MIFAQSYAFQLLELLQQGTMCRQTQKAELLEFRFQTEERSDITCSTERFETIQTEDELDQVICTQVECNENYTALLSAVL